MAQRTRPFRRLARWANDAFSEWAWRRTGRRHTPWKNASAAREITGPFGAPGSPAYRELERSTDRYVKSFDRHLPPSLHISERDRLRNGNAITLSERAIEDWQTDNRTTDPT